MRPDVSIRAGWHPLALLAVLSLWLGTVGNVPFWSALWALPEHRSWHGALNLLAWATALSAVTLTLLCWLVWPRWLKPVGWLLLLTSALSSHFMRAYGVVIDPTMLANAMQTDAREVRDLLGLGLWASVLLGAVLPGWWWGLQPVRAVSWRRLLPLQLGASALLLLGATVLLWLTFQDLASLMRNHKPLRYMVNPWNTVYALTHQAVAQGTRAQLPLQTLGEDARLDPAPESPGDAPLLVLVVGETARAANVGLNGYARDTTPRLGGLQARGELVYFSNVQSCGTNTQTSVPCMFSAQTRKQYDPSNHQENLLDVLQRAGLAVLWLDNQSGCKGVCDRVPHADTGSQAIPVLCEHGECFDEVLLNELPSQLQRLDPVRQSQGTVVVLHQMGSHGPAYHKRTPGHFKPYLPECKSAALQECTHEELVNAYDNTVRYTDHFLAETIEWLRTLKRPTALLYVSDHGESLGEKGIYLHGMPYSFAPKEQTHVPMAVWLSDRWQTRRGVTTDCLGRQQAAVLSHDHLFHTVLSFTGVRTRVYDPGLDIAADCGWGRAPQPPASR